MTYIETLFIVAVERDLDPVKAPSFSETYVAHTCSVCSAIIRDTAAHSDWHASLEIALEDLYAQHERDAFGD